MTCEIARFSEEKRIEYDQDMYDERRHMGEINTARRIGHEEGLAAGREEGRAAGREEGRAEGREEAKMEAGKKMLAAGMSVGRVCELTGLSSIVVGIL